jgi:drug/metabolite transporter (DMT)-like permease
VHAARAAATVAAADSMDTTHVAVALLSALLHATWNAAIMSSARPTEAMAAQIFASGLLAAPVLLWTGLPAPAAWPFLAGSAAIGVVSTTLLLGAYARGGFGAVYPVARAVSVVLVVPLAAILTGDRLSPGALAGVALIAATLALLAYGARQDSAFTLPALGWTVAAGATSAAYVMCDVNGVRATDSALAYGCVSAAANAVAMGWRLRHLGAPWRLLRTTWLVAVPAAVGAMSSYLLILWVYTHAPIAPSAALRDTSAVFAILISVLWMREKFTPARLLAALLAAAAVPLLRLA